MKSKNIFWAIFFIILIIICCIWFGFASKHSGHKQAEIYLNGEIVKTVSLSETEGEEVTAGNCELLIEKDGVSFIHSDCRDKLCIKRGKLKRKGDTMACVPEKVVAVIKSENKDDFHIATY